MLITNFVQFVNFEKIFSEPKLESTLDVWVKSKIRQLKSTFVLPNACKVW